MNPEAGTLARRVSQALQRHRFSEDRISVDGHKDGRVAVIAVADWLDDVSKSGKFVARITVKAVANILRAEVRRDHG